MPPRKRPLARHDERRRRRRRPARRVSRNAALVSARLVAVWLCAIGAAGAAVQVTELVAIRLLFEGRSVARIFAAGIPFVAGVVLWFTSSRFADAVQRDRPDEPAEVGTPARDTAHELAVVGLALAGIYLIATAVNPIVTVTLQLIDGPLLPPSIDAGGFWRSHWWRLVGQIARIVIGTLLVVSRQSLAMRIARVR